MGKLLQEICDSFSIGSPLVVAANTGVVDRSIGIGSDAMGMAMAANFSAPLKLAYGI